jgi:PD-(D/E)XK nuclease family transposase
MTREMGTLDDYVFKKIFDDQLICRRALKVRENPEKPEIIIGSLNDILGLLGTGMEIKEVDFLDTIHNPDHYGRKLIMLDVHAKDKNGDHYIVEILKAGPFKILHDVNACKIGSAFKRHEQLHARHVA